MKQYIIKGKTGTSKILLDEKIANLKNYLPDSQIIIITDKNLLQHYNFIISEYDYIEIGTGEAIKTLDTIQFIYNEFLRLKADRSTFILGFGGGIVCDIAGYAASTYMRGLRFGYVSTSLLSQVDASVGGKTGVNFNGYKNIIGVFQQPEFVLCDVKMLDTLPKKEFLSGFAEIIKHTLIADYEMFSFIEKNYQAAINRDPDILGKIIANSIKIKSAIVNTDETEQGERRKLNFGHTFGHAIERNSNLTHGEAVSIGMMVACKISEQKGLINKLDISQIEKLLLNFNLPLKTEINKSILFDNIKKDKKRSDNKIHFIVLNKIGEANISLLTLKEIEDLLQ